MGVFSQGIFVFLITALLIRILVIVNGKDPTSRSIGTRGNVSAPVAKLPEAQGHSWPQGLECQAEAFLYVFLSVSP